MKKNKHFRLLLLLIVLLWVGEAVNKKQRTTSPLPKAPPKTCFPSKCYSVDLIFVLDENVDGADWQRTKNFVGELVKLLPIDRRFFHLGLVKYSGRKFHLTPDPWGDKNGGLAVKLSDLGFSKANFTSSLAQATSVRTEKTSIGTGLEMARRMFLESRYGERQFIVLVGANNQERGEDLKMVVSKLKNDTVIFPLAFGSQIDNTTLTTIATIPNRFWWFPNSTQLQTATTALLDAFLHRCPFVRPERCVDSDPCTQDICDPYSGRCHYVKGNCRVGSLSLTKSNPSSKTNTSGCTNNNQCEDGNHCTTNICVNGHCATSFNSLPCQSGDKCSAGDVCHLGKCAPGNRSKCDDGNPCTDNTCDPVTGQCSFKYNTKPCNDEDRCTVDDRCHRGVCRGKPKSCDDGNGCTFDFCNPTNGNCSHRSLDQQSCDDGDACTMDDFCERGVCKGRSKKICTDRNPCTTDRCNSKTGTCEFSAVQDGNRCSFSLCSLDNFCLHGFCQGGREKDCDDHNSTTVDLCEPKTGRCRHLLPHNLPTEAPALPLSRAGVKGLTVPPIRLSGQAANTTTNSTSKTTTENQDSATNNLALIIIGSIVGATLVVAVILALYVVHKRKQEENGAGGKGGVGGGNQLKFQPLQEVVSPPPSSSPSSSPTPTPSPSPSPLLDPSPTTTTPAPAPVVVAAALTPTPTPTPTEVQTETPTEEEQVKPVTQQIDSDIQQIKEKIFQLQSLHQQLQLNPMSLSQPTNDLTATTTDATNTTTAAAFPAGVALAAATTHQQQEAQPPQPPQQQAQSNGPNELVFRTPSEMEMSEISKIDRLISDLPSFTPYDEPSFTPSNFEFDEPSSLIAPSAIPAPTTSPSVPTFISPPTNFDLPPPINTNFDLPPPAGPTDLT